MDLVVEFRVLLAGDQAGGVWCAPHSARLRSGIAPVYIVSTLWLAPGALSPAASLPARVAGSLSSAVSGRMLIPAGGFLIRRGPRGPGCASARVSQ